MTKTELHIWRLASANDSGRLQIPSIFDLCLNKTVTQTTISGGDVPVLSQKTSKKKIDSKVARNQCGGGSSRTPTDNQLLWLRETLKGLAATKHLAQSSPGNKQSGCPLKSLHLNGGKQGWTIMEESSIPRRRLAALSVAKSRQVAASAPREVGPSRSLHPIRRFPKRLGVVGTKPSTNLESLKRPRSAPSTGNWGRCSDAKGYIPLT